MSSSKIILSRSRSLANRSLARRVLSQAINVVQPASGPPTAIVTAQPPRSVRSIPTGSSHVGEGALALRDIGCSRRVFLLKPHLSSDEIEGLAYRIKTLTKNEALNSVLIATNNDDDAATGALPTAVVEIDNVGKYVDESELGNPMGSIFYVAGGYDPIAIFNSGNHEDEASMQALLDGISDLALATRGDAHETRIPVITVPHGLVHDGGYALCMGGYVLATRDTSFRVMNPSRGLSFDPIGLSFILPRLGWEFQQASADYAGCGLILALSGMEANASDMMETGLATHYMDSVDGLGLLERSLAEIPPWNQQNLLRKRPYFYGQTERAEDVNAPHRNVAVANLVHAFCDYNISGTDIFTNRESDFMPDDDPSLDLDYAPLHAERESDLVNYAATFDQVFQEERTLAGIIERFKEIASRESLDEEVREGVAVAKDLVERMKKRSPLALSVTYSLMQLGAKKGESLESCMAREKRAQAKLFQLKDFEGWAKHASVAKEEDVFTNWSHASVTDVSQDQVDEIIENLHDVINQLEHRYRIQHLSKPLSDGMCSSVTARILHPPLQEVRLDILFYEDRRFDTNKRN